ncbi:MAG TPA: hypothetical protein VKH35_02605 [Thermoanaerobaculia bacterium]|nr:hypothetical protein [Thermoanaerobaculia bacterium]
MKRILVAFALVLMPAILFAQAPDRDVLLTSDGTLYTVESVVNDGAAPAGVSRYLTLTIQHENEAPQTMIVPDSLSAGTSWRPALAFDDDSQTLFVFWLRMPNAMSSELLLSSYAGGTWLNTLSIDNQPYHIRYNLRIAITRRVAQLQDGGSYTDIPALLVHAVWWDETGYGENARYALISITRGVPGAPEIHDLNEFAMSPPMLPNETAPDFNSEVLKHPAFVDNGTDDSVDVIFGDTHYNLFNRVTLKPVADGRIHIPVGVRPGGPRIPAPTAFSADWSGRISTIVSPHHSGQMLLYNSTATSVDYLMYTGGKWSTVKTLALNDKLSADAAVAALQRMMTTQ